VIDGKFISTSEKAYYETIEANGWVSANDIADQFNVQTYGVHRLLRHLLERKLIKRKHVYKNNRWRSYFALPGVSDSLLKERPPLEMIETLLGKQEDGLLTCEEIAKACKLSMTTTYRYMLQMMTDGVVVAVDTTHRFGGKKRRYKLANQKQVINFNNPFNLRVA
jgi:predicted transcriptional regulator